LWIAGLVLAVLLAAAGVFFAQTDLGRADQYASVGSFFLALVTGGLSSYVALRSPGRVPADGGSTSGSRVAFGNDNVQMGDNSVMHVNRTVESSGKKRRRK
jgi:hypothetical protein